MINKNTGMGIEYTCDDIKMACIKLKEMPIIVITYTNDGNIGIRYPKGSFKKDEMRKILQETLLELEKVQD